MAAQHEKDQATMNAKMTALSKENHEEKARLKAEQAAQQEEFDNKMYGLQYQMELTDKEHAKKNERNDENSRKKELRISLPDT